MVVAVALGCVASGGTDVILMLAGVASFAFAPLAIVALPCLALLGLGSVRRSLRGDLRVTGLIVGAAWTLAPLVDQHLAGAVVIDGALADLVHHTAGWTAVLFAAFGTAPYPIATSGETR